MKCPACKQNLCEKCVRGMIVDTCYGGCGGIWFDMHELEKVDSRGAATLHAVWRDPHNDVILSEPRVCPRCPNQVLDRRWFSSAKMVKIDECPSCGGLWLDEGEFSQVYEEVNGSKITSPTWSTTLAQAIAQIALEARNQRQRAE